MQFGLKFNPVTPVPKALKAEAPGDRDLSRAEIRLLWAALTTDGSCRFGVATGLRVQEVVEARWSEIDLESRRWELPASDRQDRNGTRILREDEQAWLQANRSLN